jgi:copper(I)-binding protein
MTSRSIFPMRPRLAVAALALLVTAAAAGCTDSGGGGGGLEVIGARVDYPANPAVAAVRMEIVNDSDADDTLIAVSSPDADASVHRSTTSADGVASMDHITELPIPAGETVEFAPGGLHVMLEEPDRDLEIGDEVELVLTFERAGEQRLTVPVVEPGTTAADIEAES